MFSSCIFLALCLLVTAFICTGTVSAQSSGEGGGTCYEGKMVYACPGYTYNRVGSGATSYEHRVYKEQTWLIESAYLPVIMSPNPKPIEGSNSEKLIISRAVAPISVISIPIENGDFTYQGLFFLPPLAHYPPPEPINRMIQVAGGHLEVFSQSFSLNTIPTDNEINEAADSFGHQLATDGVKVWNITATSFYDDINTTGNWSISS